MATAKAEPKNDKQSINASRGNYFKIDPSIPLIIGRDTKHRSKAEHPLFSTRNLDNTIDRGLVESLKRFGCRQTTEGRKNGRNKNGEDIIEMVFGNRRCRHLRIANEELKAEGKDPWPLPIVIRNEDDNTSGELIHMENSQRKDVDAISRALGMREELDKGKEPKYVAEVLFGCDVQTMERTIELLSLDDTVRKAITNGQISAHAAYELRNEPREDQRKILADLIGTPEAHAVDPGLARSEDGNESGSEPSPKRKRKSPTAEDVKTAVAKSKGEEKYTRIGRVMLNRIISEYSRRDSKIKDSIDISSIYMIRAILGKGSPNKVAGLAEVMNFINEKYAKKGGKAPAAIPEGIDTSPDEEDGEEPDADETNEEEEGENYGEGAESEETAPDKAPKRKAKGKGKRKAAK